MIKTNQRLWAGHAGNIYQSFPLIGMLRLAKHLCLSGKDWPNTTIAGGRKKNGEWLVAYNQSFF